MGPLLFCRPLLLLNLASSTGWGWDNFWEMLSPQPHWLWGRRNTLPPAQGINAFPLSSRDTGH